MAQQKTTAAPRARGGKKSEKKSGGQKSSGRRASEVERRARKVASVRYNLAAQKRRQARANRSGRTERGSARAMRRGSVTLATGATRNLAKVERSLRGPSPEEQRERDAKERLVQAIFGVDADGNRVPPPDSFGEQVG